MRCQKKAMRRRMKKLRVFKLRRYSGRLINLRDYLAVFHGAKISDKICITELNGKK